MVSLSNHLPLSAGSSFDWLRMSGERKRLYFAPALIVAYATLPPLYLVLPDGVLAEG